MIINTINAKVDTAAETIKISLVPPRAILLHCALTCGVHEILYTVGIVHLVDAHYAYSSGCCKASGAGNHFEISILEDLPCDLLLLMPVAAS